MNAYDTIIKIKRREKITPAELSHLQKLTFSMVHEFIQDKDTKEDVFSDLITRLATGECNRKWDRVYVYRQLKQEIIDILRTEYIKYRTRVILFLDTVDNIGGDK